MGNDGIIERIQCQERECPFGKNQNQRCVFGEVYKDDIPPDIKIREIHKCKRGNRMVTVTLQTA